MIDYKYSEDRLVAELKAYVDTTYKEHYSQGTIQASEFIVDQLNSVDFLVGNIIKYAARLGKKDGYNEKDIFKVMHYAIMTLHYMRKKK